MGRDRPPWRFERAGKGRRTHRGLRAYSISAGAQSKDTSPYLRTRILSCPNCP